MSLYSIMIVIAQLSEEKAVRVHLRETNTSRNVVKYGDSLTGG